MVNDFVLVRLKDSTITSKGGILLTNIKPPCEGTVISVGEGKVLPNGIIAAHNIEVGDEVIFGENAKNIPLKHEGETLYVMKIEEIFGKKQ